MINVMKKAHEITKKIIRKGDSYKATFRLALSFAHSLVKKGVNKMVELKGTEKQVKWANEIRENVMYYLNRAFKIQMEEIEEEGERKGKTIEERKQIQTNRFNKIIDEVMSNENATFYIDNFKYIKKYGSNKSVAEKLEKLDVKNGCIISILKDRDFDKYICKDDDLTYDTKNLKRLEGTEKQVKWANEIRNEFLKLIEIFEEAANNLDSSAYDDEIKYIKINIRDILNNDKSTFYIEKLRNLNDNIFEKIKEKTYKKRIMDTLALTNSILGRY